MPDPNIITFCLIIVKDLFMPDPNLIICCQIIVKDLFIPDPNLIICCLIILEDYSCRVWVYKKPDRVTDYFMKEKVGIQILREREIIAR